MRVDRRPASRAARKRPEPHLWSIPREWAGEPAFILGGGPSLKGVNVETLRERGRVLAINNAYRIAPWADALFFVDRKWWGAPYWHCRTIKDYLGPHIVTQAPATHEDLKVQGRIRRIKRTSMTALSVSDRTRLSGWCSGSMGLNLAFLFGADPVVLLGFDMQRGHWHDGYNSHKSDKGYASEFIPYFDRMAPRLAHEGVRVICANRESALECFEKATIQEVLEWLPRKIIRRHLLPSEPATIR